METYHEARGRSLQAAQRAVTAVANWFYIKRPMVMKLVAMATPLGSAVLSLVYQFCVTHYGWRSAFFALGVALWGLVVIPGLIFLRRQPEDLGLLPDGASRPSLVKPLEHEGAVDSQVDVEYSWSRSDAASTGTLWFLVVGAFLSAIGTGGVAFHMAAYLTDGALAPGLAASVVSTMALSGGSATGHGVLSPNDFIRGI